MEKTPLQNTCYMLHLIALSLSMGASLTQLILSLLIQSLVSFEEMFCIIIKHTKLITYTFFLGPLSMGSRVQILRNQFGLI
jgi:hypothetical protein